MKYSKSIKLSNKKLVVHDSFFSLVENVRSLLTELFIYKRVALLLSISLGSMKYSEKIKLSNKKLVVHDSFFSFVENERSLLTE